MPHLFARAACLLTLLAAVPAAAQPAPQPAPLPPEPPAAIKSQPAPTPPPPQAKASAQAEAQGEQDNALVLACKTRALSVLKQKSPSVEDIFIDMDGITVARAELTVEDTRVEAVIMGEAYIQRDRSDKVHRFLCLTGPQGKVLMTFFTQR